MPKGNPTARTKASEKYQKKAGYSVKGFKLKGDVDANGKVEVADAVMLLKYLLTSGDVTDAEAADMNEDGVLNVTDLSLLKHEILK